MQDTRLQPCPSLHYLHMLFYMLDQSRFFFRVIILILLFYAREECGHLVHCPQVERLAPKHIIIHCSHSLHLLTESLSILEVTILYTAFCRFLPKHSSASHAGAHTFSQLEHARNLNAGPAVVLYCSSFEVAKCNGHRVVRLPSFSYPVLLHQYAQVEQIIRSRGVTFDKLTQSLNQARLSPGCIVITRATKEVNAPLKLS
mmetsp:Transcript_41434/g.107342  ORF Transcript_41434/g.107342 Transcript_41434/m.107342 type:complete len:201 (+) Transcript_41434:1714-2316(+)